MKTAFLKFVAVCAIASSAWSCGDKSDTTADPLYCKVDGEAWSVKSPVIKVVGEQLSITGIKGTSNISITTKAKVGTHKFEDITAGNACILTKGTTTFNTASCALSGISGEVIITSIDLTAKKVSGTFSAKVCTTTGTSSQQITEGAITNAPIQ